jgi:hypothetical protein
MNNQKKRWCQKTPLNGFFKKLVLQAKLADQLFQLAGAVFKGCFLAGGIINSPSGGILFFPMVKKT